MFSYVTGWQGAELLGYDRNILKKVPKDLLNSFCGVGNPFALGKIKTDDTVLDVGCGAGFDLFVAARLTGPTGKVCGIDLNWQMLEKSKKVFAGLGVREIETKHVCSDEIPYSNSTFDVIISNGVINLSPDKPQLFKEIYRVLKPEGSLQFADMVQNGALPPQMAGSLEAWSQ